MSIEKDEVPESPDVHFVPLVNLPAVSVKPLEEEEEELIKLPARLYRYDNEEEPAQWKERGRGDIKILKHKESGTCRILMRRDKTLKICANHFVLPHMVLKPNCGSDRAWVWSTLADFADEEQKQELLAIKLINAESATKFKETFDEAKEIMKVKLEDAKTDDEKFAEKMASMSLKDNKTDEQKTDDNSDEEENSAVKSTEDSSKPTDEQKKTDATDEPPKDDVKVER